MIGRDAIIYSCIQLEDNIFSCFFFLDQMFDRFAREKQTNEKQKHEKLISSLATSLSNKVEKTVKNEIKNSVNSGEELCLPSVF